MRNSKVVIVGGGLAGMSTAKELAKRDIRSTILECSTRMGGKAGAELNKEAKAAGFSDHGYHIFPKWYVNVRQVLKDIGVLDTLIDFDRVHYLRTDEFPQLCTLYEPSIRNIWRNIRSRLSYAYVALLGMYSVLDLSSRKFNNEKAVLDRQSFNGFIRSRFYATKRLAEIHQGFVLQASAIPSYRISAMTAANVVGAYLKSPSPLQSILPTDLSSGFITPFKKHLVEAGVEIQSNTKVTRIQVDDFLVTEIEIVDTVNPNAGSKRLKLNPDDFIVLATPCEVTRQFVTNFVISAEETASPKDLNGSECRLADLQALESVPMAGFDIYFNRKLASIPREHVVCYRSRYELSFLDISQNWECFKKRPDQPTVLSVIASNFVPLKTLNSDDAMKQLLRELAKYLKFGEEDIDFKQSQMHQNLNSPLFLNTVGSWTFRPKSTTRIKNLFLAGDYCQTTADLTTMEGAIQSGMNAANQILDRLGGERVIVQTIPRYPRWQPRLAVWVAMPIVFLVFLYGWIREKIEDDMDETKPTDPRKVEWMWRHPVAAKSKSKAAGA